MLEVYSKTNADIQDVELEISFREVALADGYAIANVACLVVRDATDTHRDVGTDVVHWKDYDTRMKTQFQLVSSCVGILCSCVV